MTFPTSFVQGKASVLARGAFVLTCFWLWPATLRRSIGGVLGAFGLNARALACGEIYDIFAAGMLIAETHGFMTFGTCLSLVHPSQLSHHGPMSMECSGLYIPKGRQDDRCV